MPCPLGENTNIIVDAQNRFVTVTNDVTAENGDRFKDAILLHQTSVTDNGKLFLSERSRTYPSNGPSFLTKSNPPRLRNVNSFERIVQFAINRGEEDPFSAAGFRR